MKRLLLALSLGLSLLAAIPNAGAQTPADLDRAKASFKAGANAYAAGDYLAAIQALDTAYSLSPLPAIAFSLAQAERKQYFVDGDRAHLERAITLFKRYLEQEPRGSRREDASLAVVQLEPLLGNKAPPSESSGRQPARPTRLMIESSAPGAQISLDGAPPTASPLIREVTPGRHRARVTAKGFYDVERIVTAVQGELLLTEVDLRELPSSLFVWAPTGSEVIVDGVFVGQGGGLVTVPLATGEHQLTVTRKGRRMVRRDVRIERGQSRTEIVTLEPTTQRRLSELLFIGGGAALGVSLVWSAFAIRSENDAEEYLRSKDRRNVAEAERVAYEASIVERNRFRTVATVSIAGSVGMLVTGLFLHELDYPSSPAAPRRDAPRSARLPRRVAFVPQVSAEGAAASVEMRF